VNPAGAPANNLWGRLRRLLAERTMWTVAVVVGRVLAEDRRQMTLADDKHPSVPSRRTVPTRRSANAFARGACGGVWITSMSAAANTASKAVVKSWVNICST
jgi:hypothetical protein